MTSLRTLLAWLVLIASLFSLALAAYSLARLAGINWSTISQALSGPSKPIEREDGRIGFDPPVTRQYLLQLAGALKVADRKGDAALAMEVVVETTRVMSLLNDVGDKSSAQRDCLLAAAHVGDGAGAIASGGTWSSEQRFLGALDGCR